MQITSQSEWMEARKQADVMGPDGHFEVIQMQDETSIFFSLGTDRVLYATREVQDTAVGWMRRDLSSDLSSWFGGAPVEAKAFAVSQNCFTGKWDMMLAVTVNKSDQLFISQDNDYLVQSAVAPDIVWSLVPCDADGSSSSTIQIADVFVMNIPKAGTTFIVDFWRTPGINDSLDRYYVIPGKFPQWHKHLLAIDLDAGTVNTVIGQRSKDSIPGIYSYGQIEGQSELIYVPIYNIFRRDSPPRPVRLTVPSGTTSIASAVDQGGHSSLFVSHPGGLSVFPPTVQNDGSTPVPCITDPIVAGASQLQAYSLGTTTSVWGRNAQGGLFYATCPGGSEAKSSAWSAPVLILPRVENFAFYNGMRTNSHTLFAHVNGQNIIELDQDPITSEWRQRKILLPSTDLSHAIIFHGYSTRIEVLDDNKILQPDIEVNLTSISPAPVYVNDIYYILNPNNPVKTKTDANGSITVIQPTESLAVVCYRVSLATASGPSTLIDPSLKAMQKLSNIETGHDLASIQITDSAGNSKSFLPASVSDNEREAAAQAIKHFSEIKSTLNQDGSPTKPTSPSTNTVFGAKSLSNSSGQHVFTLAMDRNAARGQRVEFLKNQTSRNAVSISTRSIGSDLTNVTIAIGDLFQAIGNAINTGLQTLEVHVIDGIYQFVVRIGDTVYHALLDCAFAIARAMEFVFMQLKVLFEDLVAWLGFLFAWPDIVRTHHVMKNLIKQYINKAFNSLSTLEETVDNAFDGLEQRLNTWADLETPGKPVSQFAGSSSGIDGISSPQAHWGLSQMKSNAGNAEVGGIADETNTEGLEQVFEILKTAVAAEGTAIEQMITQIRDDIVGQLAGLSPMEILTKLLAIIGKFLLETAKGLIISTLEVVRALVDGCLSVLDTPINIPIISPLYEEIAGAELSILDLVVLVLSIPATILYRIATKSVPFPDNDSTHALITATSIDAFKPKILVSETTKRATSANTRIKQPGKLVARGQEIIPDEGIGADVYRVFSITGRFFGIFANFLGQVVQDVEWGLNGIVPETPPLWRRLGATGNAISLVPTIIDAFSKFDLWETIMTDIVAGLTLLKTIIGATSIGGSPIWESVDPYVQIVLQLASIPPAAGSVADSVREDEAKDSDYVGLAASICGVFAGVLNPISMVVKDKRVSVAFFVSANGCVILQEALMVANVGLVIDNK